MTTTVELATDWRVELALQMEGLRVVLEENTILEAEIALHGAKEQDAARARVGAMRRLTREASELLRVYDARVSPSGVSEDTMSRVTTYLEMTAEALRVGSMLGHYDSETDADMRLADGLDVLRDVWLEKIGR